VKKPRVRLGLKGKEGTVVSEGEQQSVVKWDDGTEQCHPNYHLTKGQQAMLEDGCPLACLLPSDPAGDSRPRTSSRVSAEAIRPRPALTMPPLPDTGTTAVLVDAATQHRNKSLTRIAVMKDRAAVKEGQRWDAGKARWVPDAGYTKPRTSSALVSPPRSPSKPRNKSDDVATKLLGLTLPEIKQLAVTNKMWKPEYDKLALGLARMTLGNRLRAMVKREEKIKW
jgi:hypothetical protein